MMVAVANKKKRVRPPKQFPLPMTISESSLRPKHTIMIRPFTIFCKLNQITFSDFHWFCQEYHALDRTDGSCPACHARMSMGPFASYRRYLAELEGGEPVTRTVTVQRYRCGSCRRTHALLPSMLVPYSSYSLRFILQVLRAYFLRTDTVAGICGRAGIAVSTLYRWKQLFMTHKQLWLGVLEAACRANRHFLDQLSGDILRHHHRAFRVSFLQPFRRTVREPPLRDTGYPPAFP